MDVKASDSPRRDQKRELGFLAQELIGLFAKVLESPRIGLVGLEGVVEDETRNTLVLRTPNGRKIVPKEGCTFEFGGHPGVRVKGDWLCARPEDRTKRIAELLQRNRLR